MYRLFATTSSLLLALPLAAWEWEGQLTLQHTRGYELSLEGLGRYAPTARDGTGLRLYDDGFVGDDDFGSARTLTSYWGYESLSQVPEGEQVVVFSSAAAAGAGRSTREIDGGVGLEATARGIFWRGERSSLGLLLGLGVGRVAEEGTFTLRGLPVEVVRDAYPYLPSREDFVAAAPPGHRGSPSGLGPLLHTEFTRAIETAADAASLAGSFDTHAQMVSGLLGLSYGYALGEHLELRLDAGLLATRLEVDLAIAETVSAYDLPRQRRAWEGSLADTHWGAFGRVSILLDLTPSNGLRAGVRWVDQGALEAEDHGSALEASFDAGSILSLELGWDFRF